MQHSFSHKRLNLLQMPGCIYQWDYLKWNNLSSIKYYYCGSYSGHIPVCKRGRSWSYSSKPREMAGLYHSPCSHWLCQDLHFHIKWRELSQETHEQRLLKLYFHTSVWTHISPPFLSLQPSIEPEGAAGVLTHSGYRSSTLQFGFTTKHAISTKSLVLMPETSGKD